MVCKNAHEMFIFVLYHKHDHISTCSDMCIITISLFCIRFRKIDSKLSSWKSKVEESDRLALPFLQNFCFDNNILFSLFLLHIVYSPLIHLLSVLFPSHPFILFVFPPPSLLSPSSLPLFLPPPSLSLSLSLPPSLYLSVLPPSLLSPSSLSPSSLPT